MGCVSSHIFEEVSNYESLQPDENLKNKNKRPLNNPKVISGDITKKNEAKWERERAMKLRQEERITAAEEISLRTIEEKERLSLGTRSRGTSRVSSRAGSPSLTSKKVHFKNEDKSADKEQPMTNVQYKQTVQNGDVISGQSKAKKKKHRKNAVEPTTDNDTNDPNLAIANNNNNKGVTEKEHKLEKKLSIIEERASSRNSGKSLNPVEPP